MTLRFEDAGRRFGHHTVFEGVDLRLEAGQRIALVGPNGAGKTTLIHLAAGLLRPTSGRVTRDGRPMTDPAARQGMAHLGQEAPVYPELTVREHLQWWGRMHGRTIDDDWLDAAGLRRQAEDRAGGLSRGQRQRLHLAMALGTRPDLVLLDEPTTALDHAGQAWLIESLADHPAAMLVATHDATLPDRLDATVRHLEAAPRHA